MAPPPLLLPTGSIEPPKRMDLPLRWQQHLSMSLSLLLKAFSPQAVGWMAKKQEVAEDGRDSCFSLGPGQFHFCHLWAAPNDSAIV